MAKHTIDELRQWQALPLSIKLRMTEERIRMWVREYGENGVYVSFSGGKDSTVLLDIVRNRMGYTDIPAVFVDTGLEYPEVREFVKTFDNVVWLKPKMQFRKVIETYGYPFISKPISHMVECVRNNKDSNVRRFFDGSEKGSKYNAERYAYFLNAPMNLSSKCCDIMKKHPAHKYATDTKRCCISGEMACESNLRRQNWLKNGCNGFDLGFPKSTPMAFWTEQDVLRYIKENSIKIASVYGDVVTDEARSKNIERQLVFGENGIEESKCVLKTTGCSRTGCMFCGYGCHLEKEGEGRFERMKETHPKQYEWIMRDWDKGGLGYKKIIDWMNEHGNLNIRY